MDRFQLARKKHHLGVLCFSILFILVAITTVQANSSQSRFALVIGNSTYKNTTTLKNPINDANAINKTLKRLGFDVSILLDANLVTMQAALRKFGKKSRGSDIALIYYAGHGIEVDNQNYLVPTDAVLASDQDIEWETVSLDMANRAVSGANGLSMVLLDACRNNPFVNQMQTSHSSRSIGRGLAPVEPTIGSLISFAAREGTVADDGAGNNSPYTAALLKHIVEPGVDVRRIFDKVRDSVITATKGVQQPFVYSSLPGRDVLLTPHIKSPVKIQNLTGSAILDLEYWNSVKVTNSIELLQSYLDEFKDGKFRKIARFRIEGLERNNSDETASKDILTLQPIKELKPSVEKLPLSKTQKSSIYGPTAYDFAFGVNSKINYKKALEIAQKGAEEEDAVSQMVLGYLYFNGFGVQEDKIVASNWYKLSAEQKNSDALDALGYMYSKGIGVGKDYSKAVEFYLESANLGNAFAKYHLAGMYERGLGITKDKNEALKLYRDAAEAGNRLAQSRLKKIGQ